MSAASAIDLTLLLGNRPAPKELMLALHTVRVDVPAHGPVLFNLTFGAAPSVASFQWANPVVSHSMLTPFTRVRVLARVGNGLPTALVDGVITHHDFGPGTAAQADSFSVIGEDLSVLMNLEQKCVESTGMDVPGIVNKVLAPYRMKGLQPDVRRPSITDAALPDHKTRLQNETDREYVTRLAGEVGFVFYVVPGATPLTNTAYWGPQVPPGSAASTQAALSVNLGSMTNVDSIKFTYDPLRATTASAWYLDEDQEGAQPVQISVTSATASSSLSNVPALSGGTVRKTIIDVSGATQNRARQLVQARVDESSMQVATAVGKLSVTRYGAILQPRKLVGVRGASLAYDGTWYVEKVSHNIGRGSYTQDFTLNREGLDARSHVVSTC